MNLQEFICETLVQITRGVSDAQAKAKHGTVINPLLRMVQRTDDRNRRISTIDTDALKGTAVLPTSHGRAVASVVEFDVALRVGSRKSRTASAGSAGVTEVEISVADATLDVSGQSSAAGERDDREISRIKFSVPVQFSAQ